MFLNTEEAVEFVEAESNPTIRDLLRFIMEQPYYMEGDDEFHLDQPDSGFDLLFLVETLNRWLIDRRTAVAALTSQRGGSIRLPDAKDPRRFLNVESAVRCIHRIADEGSRAAIISGVNQITKRRKAFRGSFDLHYFCRLMQKVMSDKMTVVRLLIDGRSRLKVPTS